MAAEEDVVTSFYEAFARKDARAMGALYHDEARFSDPVFPDLDAPHVRGMWRMLCGIPGSNLVVTFRDVSAGPGGVTAHWDADYVFTTTGRKVQNSVDARLEVRDGRIVRHEDRFDLWRWTRMALGPPGLLLGWSPLVTAPLRSRAAAQLERFLASERP